PLETPLPLLLSLLKESQLKGTEENSKVNERGEREHRFVVAKYDKQIFGKINFDSISLWILYMLKDIDSEQAHRFTLEQVPKFSLVSDEEIEAATKKNTYHNDEDEEEVSSSTNTEIIGLNHE